MGVAGHAVSSGRFRASNGDYNIINAVATNAAEASRTATIHLRGEYRDVKMVIIYTGTNASTISVTSYGSLDGTNYARLQSRAIAAGVATDSDLLDQNSVSGSETYVLEFGATCWEYMKFVVAADVGDAADFFTVQIAASA